MTMFSFLATAALLTAADAFVVSKSRAYTSGLMAKEDPNAPSAKSLIAPLQYEGAYPTSLLDFPGLSTTMRFALNSGQLYNTIDDRKAQSLKLMKDEEFPMFQSDGTFTTMEVYTLGDWAGLAGVPNAPVGEGKGQKLSCT